MILIPNLSLCLIAMADQLSTAAKKSKKKGGGTVNFFRDLIKRPKPAKDSASQTQVSVSSASGAHDPDTGNDARSTKSIASSKYIGSILVSSTLIQ